MTQTWVLEWRGILEYAAGLAPTPPKSAGFKHKFAAETFIYYRKHTSQQDWERLNY